MQLATHDTKGRRLRLAPVSTGVRVEITQADINLAIKCHNHGPLNTLNLFELTKADRTNIGSLRRRLTLLSNEKRLVFEGEEFAGPFLTRPFSQNDTFNARANYLVYDCAPAAQKILQSLELWSENRPRNRNPWKHSCMASAITSAIEVGCIERGYKYISQHELLDLKGAELKALVGYSWDGKLRDPSPLIPDGLFAIDYGGKFRVFALEADRSSEPFRADDDNRKSLKKNVLQYETFIRTKQYLEHFKLEQAGLIVLTVTMNADRMQSFLDLVEEETGPNTFMWAMSASEFAPPFRPSAVVRDLFEKPWQRAGHPPIDIMQA